MPRLTHNVVAPAYAKQNQNTHRRIRQIIMMPLRMVDAILAPARSPSFERHQLINEPRIIQQLNFARVNQRQRLTINFRLHPLANENRNPALLKSLGDETSPPPIERDLSDAVAA